MSYDIVITGTVVLPDGPLENGWIAIKGEKIAAIGSGSDRQEQYERRDRREQGRSDG